MITCIAHTYLNLTKQRKKRKNEKKQKGDEAEEDKEDKKQTHGVAMSQSGTSKRSGDGAARFPAATYSTK